MRPEINSILQFIGTSVDSCLPCFLFLVMIHFSLSIPFTYAVIPFYIDVFSDGPSRLISSAVQTAAAGVFIWSRSFALVAAHTMRCF
jgi:hypothetical protein